MDQIQTVERPQLGVFDKLELGPHARRRVKAWKLIEAGVTQWLEDHPNARCAGRDFGMTNAEIRSLVTSARPKLK